MEQLHILHIDNITGLNLSFEFSSFGRELFMYTNIVWTVYIVISNIISNSEWGYIWGK